MALNLNTRHYPDNMPHEDLHTEATLIFVTDPICSWCWGMLPELLLMMDALQGRIDFQLRCAGLQVGSQNPLSEAQINDLTRLWKQVAETTGQRFSFALPPDKEFIYHSEIPCRALQIARRLGDGNEPWEFFSDIQTAFYLHARNICNLDVLCELAAPYNISENELRDGIADEAIIDSTRREFDWCKSQATHALPSLLLDRGDGPKLVCGGFATAKYLIPDVKARLTTH